GGNGRRARYSARNREIAPLACDEPTADDVRGGRPMTGRGPNVIERLHAMSDDQLGAELTGLGRALAWPATPDIGTAVVDRLATRPSRWAAVRPVLFARPARRALVLALIALLVVAGIAGALGLGLPGIRILFGPPASPSPSVQTPSGSPGSVSPNPVGGALLDLGRRVTLAEAQQAV